MISIVFHFLILVELIILLSSPLYMGLEVKSNSKSFRTAGADIQPKFVTGCASTRFGCCWTGGNVYAMDAKKSNCADCFQAKAIYEALGYPKGCTGTAFGCCPNSCTKPMRNVTDNCLEQMP